MDDARRDWHTDAYPELRPGPPWVMEEMVAAQPAAVRQVLARPDGDAERVADLVRAANGPVCVVGCGTSEHGAMAVAALLDAALADGRSAWPPHAVARQALEAAGAPQAGGVCIGISHDGGTRATTLALEAARAAGAATALVTAVPDGAAAAGADVVLVTPTHDTSWCHTVAYTSAIAAGAAVARAAGLAGAEPDAAGAVLRAALDRRAPAGSLADARRIVVAGAGLDRITARELALKIAEGARIPTAMHELETLLHGHLAGEDADTGAVLIHTGGDARVTRRTQLARAALEALGMSVVAVLSPAAGDDVTPSAGRIETTAPGEVHPVLHRLLEGAAALQRLTLALVHARGVNPDLIRREEAPWRAAAAAAEDAPDW